MAEQKRSQLRNKVQEPKVKKLAHESQKQFKARIFDARIANMCRNLHRSHKNTVKGDIPFFNSSFVGKEEMDKILEQKLEPPPGTGYRNFKRRQILRKGPSKWERHCQKMKYPSLTELQEIDDIRMLEPRSALASQQPPSSPSSILQNLTENSIF